MYILTYVRLMPYALDTVMTEVINCSYNYMHGYIYTYIYSVRVYSCSEDLKTSALVAVSSRI